ncbi:MAG: hypothetical protein KDD35_01450 [Bdellovibrionales bacterium]|nr:hypothetical protein [Bdellovibrionales bacterium]
MKTVLTFFILSVFSTSALAMRGEGRGGIDRDIARNSKESKPEIVKWEGFVVADGGHTTRHDHDMEFVRESDGETFDIVDSPDLEKVHCESSKKLRVKIEAEKTSRFLFWGGNLIVKNFEVLEELESIPHQKYKPRTVSRSFGGRDRP